MCNSRAQFGGKSGVNVGMLTVLPGKSSKGTENKSFHNLKVLVDKKKQ